MGIEEIKKYIKFIGIKDYYKVNRLLQTYKAIKIKIMTLKQEKNAFNYDEERVKRWEDGKELY